MRFERMDYTQRRKALKRLHRRLNKRLFGNLLSEKIILCVGNVGGNLAGRFNPLDGFIDGMQCPIIELSHEFVDEDLSKCRTQKQQIYLLTMVLLHEMIHQYCFENGIDDTGHNDRFIEEAKKHGLISSIGNGIYQEELDLKAQLSIMNFRI